MVLAHGYSAIMSERGDNDIGFWTLRDLSFARVHYIQLVDTMWVMAADLSSAGAHYVQIADTTWVPDAD